MGRRKIEMKLVKDRNSRQVTFSKRRIGLFKKASELSTLCGAEVAIIVFSPGGKPFSYGHPNLKTITQRFLNEEMAEPSNACQNPSPNESSKDIIDLEINNLAQELDGLLKEVDAEKKRGKMLEKEVKKSKGDLLTSKGLNIDEPRDKHELLKLKQTFEELRNNVKARLGEMDASSSLLLLARETDLDVSN